MPAANPGIDVFATADGRYVVLGIASEVHFWDALCGTVGLDQLAGISFTDRRRRAGELRDALTGAVARFSRDELIAMLTAADVPVAPVLSRQEMLQHPHFAA